MGSKQVGRQAAGWTGGKADGSGEGRGRRAGRGVVGRGEAGRTGQAVINLVPALIFKSVCQSSLFQNGTFLIL